ncbi:MAG: hypothetical protein ACRDCH_02060 [Metamycoplasmataceae bacterium]
MNNMGAEYASRKEIDEYKKSFEKIIDLVKKDVENEFGKQFNHQIVGSAERNMVITFGKGIFDIDYQLFFPEEVANSKPSINLKGFIQQSFKKNLIPNESKSEKWKIKMSTSVITIKLIDKNKNQIKKSFDLALLRKNQKRGTVEILKGKNYNKNNKDRVRWLEMKKSKDLLMYIEGEKIKEANAEAELRRIFLEKRIDNNKIQPKNRKPTFALFLESLKETLDSINSNKNKASK